MKKLLLPLAIFVFSLFEYQPSKAAPVNDNFSAATSLAAGTSCNTNGTTLSGTIQNSGFGGTGSEPLTCNASWNETVWYYFTPTSSSVDVQMTLTGVNGATWCPASWGIAIYDAGTGGGSQSNVSSGSMVSCVNTNTVGSGDGVMVSYLTGLNTSHTYYIQVGYASSGPCKSPNFCIMRFNKSSEKLHNCGTCSTPCGASCPFSSQPVLVTQVTCCCTQYNVVPANEGGTTTSQCWTFTAANTSIGFQEIIESTCGTGNVTSLNWTIQSSSCGPVLGSGTLANMTFTGLTVGQTYTYCLTFTVPTSCYHSSYYPYVWGAQILPIELTDFTATPVHGVVQLDWKTASEENNNYFSLEHSTSGVAFEEIARIDGAGNSTQSLSYNYIDKDPSPGANYYRLVQNDFDGSIHYSQVVSVNIESTTPVLNLYPNPVLGNENNLIDILSSEDKDATLAIFNALGQMIFSEEISLKTGRNQFEMNTGNYLPGVYNLIVYTQDGNQSTTFIK